MSARTCLLLALMILVAPVCEVLFSSFPRIEARTVRVGSLVSDASVPAVEPTSSPALPVNAPVDAETVVAPPPSQDAPAEASTPQLAQEPSGAIPAAAPLESRAPVPEASRETTRTAKATPRRSVFQGKQVVAFYGSPISDSLGVLGSFPPDELARRLRAEAGIYDNLNGDRGVTPALDLIYAQAQAEPTENGLFLRYLDDASVNTYISLAERDDLQIILDLQIGRGSVVDEVLKIERFLVNPRVHVAIDPEYAVGPSGYPLATPGEISGDDINAVQDYLDGLVKQYRLPPKMLIIHQYMDDTVVSGDVTRHVPTVDLVLNMDAIGRPDEKVDKYHMLASRAYATHHSYNVFILQDYPISSEDDIMRLSPQPDMVIYQ